MLYCSYFFPSNTFTCIFSESYVIYLYKELAKFITIIVSILSERRLNIKSVLNDLFMVLQVYIVQLYYVVSTVWLY